MQINVTDEHLRCMAAAAINASKPVGLGWLHADPSTVVTADDVHIVEGYLSIDYYQGRMVKFHARKQDGAWTVHPDNLSLDYQSWARTYPTWEMLIEATRPK